MSEINEDILAQALFAALEKRPQILNEFADRVASLVIAAMREESIPEGTGSRSTHAWKAPPERIDELITWVEETGARIIDGAPETWALAVVAASGATRPEDVFTWAFSDTCPTSYWRRNRVPIAAPAATKSGAAKAGLYTQMLAEFRAAQTADGALAVAGIDRLIETVAEQIRFYGLVDQVKPTLAWRRNALAILRSCDGTDPGEVIVWAMRSRNHWRSNIQGVPAERTFRKIHGDYVAAGVGFNLRRDGGEHAKAIEELTHGWACYLAKLLERRNIPVRPVSHRSVWELLTGGDGGQPVPEVQLQSVVRWILDPHAGRARFYTSGDDFPPPSKVRKALVDMATDGSHSRAGQSRVATTNALAGDGMATVGSTTVTVEGI
ncbi:MULTISPECIES: hypothetical protein [unclassified Rhodococcus (in: high G+C Gram-positive bacteria)]|uniref:hypothetical protein n=1 Tax=unclassified Rhodococcus (in: high G+C Gram-positive bacteria) TaxID=192944 RepID=UPI000ABD3332|nr:MULTISPECIES: hypothetical protein [unclassified Rhodococcus (in: high G+C Gram-positive bacteria)]